MMLRRMQRVTMRDLGMMGGLFRTAGLMVLRGLAMMLGRVLVMLGRLLMVFVNVVTAHDALPGFGLIGI